MSLNNSKISTNNFSRNVSKLQRNKRQKLHKAYYSAANVLWQLNDRSGSLNSLMSQFTGDKCIKMIYALAVKVLKNHDTIVKIKKKLPKYDENALNSYLIEILIAELLFGEKSFFKYRRKDEVKYVIDNQKTITTCFYSIKKNNKIGINNNRNSFIRYVRINFLKVSKLEIVDKIKLLGFVEKTLQQVETSFDHFKKMALSLKANEFMVDFHFEDILLFNDQSTKTLTESELYQNGFIAMQDKSSLLAIEAMQLKEDMVIMDAFAAPGMKTAAIASRLNNKCTLYVNDRNKKRFNDMKVLLSRSGVKFKSITQDFTQIDPSKYHDLDILLLDPSCSGSGINRRLEYNRSNNKQNEDKVFSERCENLAKFQLAILQSALAFNAKRIIYCTCSKYQIENEDVINNLLESNPEINYTVVDPIPKWTYRGQGDYSFSPLCLRADYENTLTNGFFCCVLQRKDVSLDGTKQNQDNKNDKCYEQNEDGPAERKKRKKRLSSNNYFSVIPFT